MRNPMTVLRTLRVYSVSVFLLSLLMVASVSAQGQLINGNRTMAGALNYCIAAGTTNTYTCTLDPAVTLLKDGQCFLFKANAINTGPSTLNVNGLGAKDLRKAVNGLLVAVSGNDIGTGQHVEVCYDGTVMQIVSLGGGGGTGGGGSGNAEADGVTKGIATFTPSDFNGTAGVISLDYTSGQKASASLPGFLSNTDWTTFNSKVGTARSINTTIPLLGGGNLSTDRTFSIANALADGTTKGAATFSSSEFLTPTAGVVQLNYASGQKATASVAGFLSSADWIDFNQKVDSTFVLSTTDPVTGGGDLTAPRTLACPTCVTSAASLTINAPLIGAGSQGTAVGTRSGNTTQFATVLGTKTTNKQLAFDGSGNVIASATDIGSGSGGGLPDPGSNGYVARTALNTTVGRQLLGTTGHIVVTNPAGIAGDTTFDVGTGVLLADAVNTLTGVGRITGVPSPSAPSDATPKSYVDSVSAGLSLRSSVRTATTANLTATYVNGTAGVGATLTNSGTLAALVIDGVTLATNDRVLVKNQTTTFQNGIYTVTTVGSGSVAWVLTRATDYDQTAEVVSGSYTIVDAGASTQATTIWIMTTTGSVTLGTTGIVWSQYGAGGGTATITLTGPVTGTGTGTVPTTLANVPSGTPHLGTALFTAIASPSIPSAGIGSVYVDSISKNLAIKNDAGTINHAVQTKAPTASQWLTGLNDAGVLSAAQPAASDLSNGVTGSGAVVLGTSPSLTTPSLGVATATSLNKLTLTPPATGAILTLADGKTLTVSNTVTFTGSDASTILFGAGGTIVYTSRVVNTTPPLSGGGNFSADRTVSIADAAADGTTKGAAAFTANDFNATAGLISLDYVNAQKATTSVPGFLSAADWTTFNAKLSSSRLLSTTPPLTGGGDLSADRTLGITNAAADGTTLGVATFASADFNATAGVISLDYANGQKASASVPGFLSAADWTAFNTKLSGSRTITTTTPLAGGGTLTGDLTLSIANALADGSTKGAATFATNDFETLTAGVVSLDYVNGQKASASVPGFLTSTDWNTFNAKQGPIAWGAGLTISGTTAATASTEAGFLTNGGSTALIGGVGNAGKMQVRDNGELEYTGGEATPVVHAGQLTQSGLLWNVIEGTCTGDGNTGKLTVNGSHQVICAPDVGGGTITPGTAGNVTYYTGGNTVDDSTALRVDGTSILSSRPGVTSLVNANLTLGTHHTIYCNAGATNRDLTLPLASTATTGYYLVIKADTGAGACRLVPSGTDTINGSTTPVSLGSQWSFVELRLVSSSTPGNWYATMGVANPFQTNPQTTTYTVTAGDFASYKTIPVAVGTFTVTLPSSATPPPAGQYVTIVNYGAGVVTIARNGQNINGGVTPLTLPAGSATAPTMARILSDGTNYVAWLGGAGGGASGGTGYLQLPMAAGKLPAANMAVIDGGEQNIRVLFEDTIPTCVSWQFRMNPDYTSSPVFKFQYSMQSASSGGIAISVAVAAVSVGDTADINTKAFATANVCTVGSVPGTAGILGEISCPLTTNDSLAANDFTRVQLCRQPGNVTDTATGNLEGVAAQLLYSK